MIMSNKDSFNKYNFKNLSVLKIFLKILYFFGGNHYGLFITLMFHFLKDPNCLLGFPGGASGKEPTCHCRRCRRPRFDLWVGKIPCRREWQPTPVFLPGKSQGQRSLVGYSPWGCKSWTGLNN